MFFYDRTAQTTHSSAVEKRITIDFPFHNSGEAGASWPLNVELLLV